MPPLDGHLQSWAEIRDIGPWTGLLLGNGASIAVWDGFRYSSLYEEACSGRVSHPLLARSVSLFERLDTTNFEQVLWGLATASTVCGAIGFTPTRIGRIKKRYRIIQRALREAVRSIHLPWYLFDERRKQTLRGAFREYRSIYSLNYDLLLYWSIMSVDAGVGFKDFFWSDTFDGLNTEIWGDATRVVYLHGGIHLYRTKDGRTCKHIADVNENLLEKFDRCRELGRTPLLVTEGSSKDKLASIVTSDYLSFANNLFSLHDGGLLVFGSSLGESDQHLVDTIRRWRDRPVAIALLPGTEAQNRAAKGGMIAKLPEARLYFLDSTTHPLGNAGLAIAPL